MTPYSTRSFHGRRPLLLVASAVLLVVGLGPSLAAEEEGSLTDQLVRMLEAELSEDVIVEWLESRPAVGGSLSADDLVALKRAGASDDLLKGLLARSNRTTRTLDASMPASTAPEATARHEAVPPAPSEGAEASESAPATATSPPTVANDPLVTFRLSYLRRSDETEVGAGEPEWDLYVYLDGLPVSYLSSAEFENRPRVIEFARALPPGEHTIRVLQERHRRKRGDWRHESRVARNDFVFELAPGEPARLEVEYHERLADYSDPLTFKMTQGARVLDSGRLGGDAEFWPALCDDIEASVPAGKEPGRRQRRELESCLAWDALWGSREVPSRQEVLDAMAAFEFKPAPKGS